MTDKWQTQKFTIVGWICIVLFGAIGVVDIYLAIDDKLGLPNLPTISQYISARYEGQPNFGYIVIGLLILLGFHWFWGRK